MGLNPEESGKTSGCTLLIASFNDRKIAHGLIFSTFSRSETRRKERGVNATFKRLSPGLLKQPDNRQMRPTRSQLQSDEIRSRYENRKRRCRFPEWGVSITRALWNLLKVNFKSQHFEVIDESIMILQHWPERQYSPLAGDLKYCRKMRTQFRVEPQRSTR